MEASQARPIEVPELETVSKMSPFGALLSRTLSNYHGRYAVGVCDLELPVPHETFGNFIHKKMEGDAKAGLSLDTVLYSVFYPTPDEKTMKKAVWFPNPWQTIDGFIRMANRTPNWLYRSVAYPLAAAAIYGTTFPAKPNTRLLSPPDNSKWPLVIFSHGAGCSRLMYSSFCGELASRGYVVCTVEHRDGTSPSSVIVAEDGQAKDISWLQWTDLYWPDLPEDRQPTTDTTLRHSQLALRTREIFYTIDSMSKICNGQAENVTVASIRRPDFDWKLWEGKVDCEKPIVAGHSLGGSAAILAGGDPTFDLGGIIAFDPAIERIVPWTKPIPAPLLLVNSQEFTKAADFIRLRNLLKYSKELAGVYSISGSTHPALSDVFLIIPSFISRMTGLSCDSTRVLSLAVRTSFSFLTSMARIGSKEKKSAAVSEEERQSFAKGVRKIVSKPTTPLVNGEDEVDPNGDGSAIGKVKPDALGLKKVEGRGDYSRLLPGTFIRHELGDLNGEDWKINGPEL